ncbi:unnamed protein product, partial [Brassica rapa subsp. trilocularis]
QSSSLTLLVSATSLPCHPTTSPVIYIAGQIDLRWSNRDCIPPWSCLSFSAA